MLVVWEQFWFDSGHIIIDINILPSLHFYSKIKETITKIWETDVLPNEIWSELFRGLKLNSHDTWMHHRPVPCVSGEMDEHDQAPPHSSVNRSQRRGCLNWVVPSVSQICLKSWQSQTVTWFVSTSRFFTASQWRAWRRGRRGSSSEGWRSSGFLWRTYPGSTCLSLDSCPGGFF